MDEVAASTASKPRRVISLLGAATEMVVRLGRADLLVGRSHECDYPPSIASLPLVSAAKIDVDASSREIDAAGTDRLSLATSSNAF
jgi:iron complex transport system substrate-binding protein